MTGQGTGPKGIFSGSELGDEVDALFDALDGQSMECRLEDIDPSRKGWEIFLKFHDGDPRRPGSQAYEDFKTLSHFAKLGIARCEYQAGSKTVVLSYLEGCCDDEFPEEYIELMNKYQPRVKAPETARKGVKLPQVPEPRGSTPQIISGMKEALMRQVPVIHTIEVQVQEAPRCTVIPEELVVHEDILLEIPLDREKLARILNKVGCRDLDDLIAILQRIADDEELLFQHSKPGGEEGEMLVIQGSEVGDEVEVEVVFEEGDDAPESGETYMVNMYKDPKVKYTKPMDGGNMGFIHKLQAAIREDE